MNYIFDESQPLYLQLIELFKINIVSGVWEAGQKIDSVRNLALELDVNPNTVQRALSELENLDLAFSRRTSGRFVTEDHNLIERTRNKMALVETNQYLKQMKKMKTTESEIVDLVRQCLKEFEE